MEIAKITMELAEVGRIRSEIVKGFQEAILPLIVDWGGGKFEYMGVGWIIAGFGRHALMMTAKHITDDVLKRTMPQRSHPTALPMFLPLPRRLSSKPAKIYALMTLADGTSHALLVDYTWFSRGHDVAICHVLLRDDAPKDMVIRSCVGIDTWPQRETNKPIQVIGYSDIGPISSPNAKKEPAELFGFSFRIGQRAGVVTEVYGEQDGSIRCPGFRTNIPFDSGMSGSPVFSKDLSKWKVCGIVTSDMSTDAENMSKGGGHHSLVTELWPSMFIPMDADRLGFGGKGEEITLLDLERRRLIDDEGRASEHLTSVIDEPSGKVQYRWTGNINRNTTK